MAVGTPTRAFAQDKVFPPSGALRFGAAILAVGDVNGDDFGDIVVGAPEEDGGAGAVYLVLGSASGISSSPAWTVKGPAASGFGTSLALGDVNGDLKADLVIGAPHAVSVAGDCGAVFIHRGIAGGFNAAADWTLQGAQPGELFGWSVACLLRANNDLLSDVVVGAPGYYNNDGIVRAYYGAPGGPAAPAGWAYFSVGTSMRLGHAVVAVGDLNLDTYSDLVITAPSAAGGGVRRGSVIAFMGSLSGIHSGPATTLNGPDNDGYFGTSAVGALDQNGDGRSDLLVGSWAKVSGETWGGSVRLVFGAAAGLNPVGPTISEPQTESQYGYSVTALSRFNNDTRPDLCVGAPLFDGTNADLGRATCHAGGALFPSPTPFRTYMGPLAGRQFGEVVASAGDVNHDGYTDLAIGLPALGSSGQDGSVYVYNGGP